MKRSTIHKMYNTLNQRERVALMIAALQRGDDVEFDRLAASSAMSRFCHPEFIGMYFALQMALHGLNSLILEFASDFWRLAFTTKVVADSPPDAENVRQQLHFVAYQLLTHYSAWDLFCVNHSLDPQNMLVDFATNPEVIEGALEGAETLLPKHGRIFQHLQDCREFPSPEEIAESLDGFANKIRDLWE